MNKRNLSRWTPIAAASIAVGAMGIAATTLHSAWAADPAASASASASAAAPASASASASAAVNAPKREPIIEKLENQKIPTEKSPVPKVDEWLKATPVEVERRNYESMSCVVSRVREWIKIKCNLSVGAIFQHSGNQEGVAFWVRPIAEIWSGMDSENGGEMIFPLRAGDRRLLQFFRVQHDACVGVGFSPSVMVDETWIEGEPSPTVVLL